MISLTLVEEELLPLPHEVIVLGFLFAQVRPYEQPKVLVEFAKLLALQGVIVNTRC